MFLIDLLIGYGEVGQAIEEVFGERRTVVIVDPPKGLNPEVGESVEWMHVTIPYTNSFTTIVSDYIIKYKPKSTIIHSTVKVGTTELIEKECDHLTNLYYSPVRGRHPSLARYLRDFPKWYASWIPGELDQRIEAYYAQAGVQSRKAPNFETLEWMKLLETTTYGIGLVMWQEIERQANELPGNRQENLSALRNWLYEKKKVYDGDLGYVPIYNLTPGPIGGHCILPNLELLRDMMMPELYDWMIKSNELRKK